MTASSPPLLHACADLRADGLPLRASLAQVRVAALCRQTGRQRRVLISEAVVSITPDELASYLSCPLNDVVRVPWYFDPTEGFLMAEPLSGWPRVEVRLTSQRQRRGVRWLFVCPACERPTRRLCAVPAWERDEVGCRACLGLVYPSQSLHRTQRGDVAVLSGLCRAGTAALRQAQARDQRRFMKEYGRYAAVLGYALKFFADGEAVRALYGDADVFPVPFPDVSPLPTELEWLTLFEEGHALL